MKDTDYCALMLTMWLAPAAFAEAKVMWYVILVLFFIMSALAHLKYHYQRKLDDLRRRLPQSGESK